MLTAAIETIQLAIDERIGRLQAFLQDHGVPAPTFDATLPACPLALAASDTDHVAWVRAVPADEAARLEAWLAAIVAAITELVWN